MNTTRRFRARVAACLLAVGVVLTPIPAHGQDGGGQTSGSAGEPAPAGGDDPDGRWAVQPGGAGQRPNFAFNLAPGQRIVDTVQVLNLSDAPITFAVYAKDAFNTAEGGFALQDDDQQAVDVGSWVRLAPDTDDTPTVYTIAAGAGLEIPFEIAVPEDATPGDHAGGILAADSAPPGTVNEDVGVAIRHRIGSRVYVRVDGPVAPGLLVTDLSIDTDVPVIPWTDGGGAMTVSYEVTNIGNVRLESTAQVDVTGLFGRSVHDLPAEELPELLPGSSVRISQTFSGLPPIEPLTARVEVESADGMVTDSRSSGAFVISLGAILIPLLLAAVVVGLRRWRRSNRTVVREAVPA